MMRASFALFILINLVTLVSTFSYQWPNPLRVNPNNKEDIQAHELINTKNWVPQTLFLLNDTEIFDEAIFCLNDATNSLTTLYQPTTCSLPVIKDLAKYCKLIDNEIYGMRRVEFGIRLSLCELTDLGLMRPQACERIDFSKYTPENKHMLSKKLQDCASEFSSTFQWWTTLSNHYSSIPLLCQTLISSSPGLLSEELLDLHSNITEIQKDLIIKLQSSLNIINSTMNLNNRIVHDQAGIYEVYLKDLKTKVEKETINLTNTYHDINRQSKDILDMQLNNADLLVFKQNQTVNIVEQATLNSFKAVEQGIEELMVSVSQSLEVYLQQVSNKLLNYSGTIDFSLTKMINNLTSVNYDISLLSENVDLITTNFADASVQMIFFSDRLTELFEQVDHHTDQITEGIRETEKSISGININVENLENNITGLVTPLGSILKFVDTFKEFCDTALAISINIGSLYLIFNFSLPFFICVGAAFLSWKLVNPYITMQYVSFYLAIFLVISGAHFFWKVLRYRKRTRGSIINSRRRRLGRDKETKYKYQLASSTSFSED